LPALLLCNYISNNVPSQPNLVETLLKPRPIFLLIALPFLLFWSSCITNKRVIYLQDKNNQADTLYRVQPNNYALQKGDVIGVDVKIASENPVLKDIFTQKTQMNMNAALQNGGDYFYLNGSILDDSGYISLPIIGKIFLEGQTVYEANETVQKAFDQYLNAVYVTVRIGGLRFSVLGEVSRPGKFVVLQNRMTILEAIAFAGDLNILAKRDQLLLLRQYPDGTRLHRLDLLDESIISSPYYYIQPNDVIYAEPMKIRALGTGYTGFQTFTAVLSALSSTLLIINLIK
jgi:polysaccharide export outer membrane protein